MADINPAAWSYDTAAHLLSRAGFGHNGRYKRSTGEASQVRSLADKTPEEAVDSVLKFKTSKARGPAHIDTNSVYFDKLQSWWLDRMIRTSIPVGEKIVLFLHSHFATSKAKVNMSYHMAVQNALFREFAGGDFRELVKRVNIDPAMLWWLDGQTNKKSAPNENYGRELQELFTFGVFDFAGQRNYSQTDVKEAARILTGWRIRTEGSKLLSYFYLEESPLAWKNRHDTGAKTVFAPHPIETPNQNAANLHTEAANTTDVTLAEAEHRRLIDAIFDHIDTEGRPTVARHMARKLWKFFAYDPVVDLGTARTDLTLIDDLADVFAGSNYNLKALLRAIFLREEFYADRTRTVKSPIEFTVGSLRMLRGKLRGDARIDLATDRTGDMGQELLNPPDVFSWPSNQGWITTQTLLSRYTFARDLAQNETSGHDLGCNIYRFLDTTMTLRGDVVDSLLKLLGPAPVDSATRDELIAWLGNADPIDLNDEEYVDEYVRGLLHLILTLPHFHVH